MTTAVKWLFVGLNLPWDLDLGSFDGEGRVGGWMDGGGGSTVNDYHCKPLGSLPVGLPSKWEIYTSHQPDAGTFCLFNKPLTLIKIIRRSFLKIYLTGKTDKFAGELRDVPVTVKCGQQKRFSFLPGWLDRWMGANRQHSKWVPL